VVGKSILAFTRDDVHSEPSTNCIGFVPSYDTKATRRLFEVLASRGMQMDQQMNFLSDDGDTVRDLLLYRSPQAEHLLTANWVPCSSAGPLTCRSRS